MLYSHPAADDGSVGGTDAFVMDSPAPAPYAAAGLLLGA